MRGMRIRKVLFLLLIAKVGASPQENHCTDETNGQCRNSPSSSEEATCGLWLAESVAAKNRLGLFAGVDILKGEDVLKTGGELHIPIHDKNPREWSRLQDVWWTQGISLDFALQSHYYSYSFLPGVGVTASCHDGNANIRLLPFEEVDSLGVHRHKDPTAGTFTYRLHSEYFATEPIAAGQELLLDCRESTPEEEEEPTKGQKKNDLKEQTSTFDSNKAHCVDSLDIRQSTIPGAGRGAFSKRSVKKGETLTVSPVIAFDESEMYMTDQSFEEDDYLRFYDQIVGYQLLQNYCYGNPRSSVLLLPTGPGVNAINHDSKEVNVELRWSDSALNGDKDFLNMHYPRLIGEQDITMVLEYVAMKDIEQGDEIFLDYGQTWDKRLEYFAENEWQPPPFSAKYTSAAEYKKQHQHEPFRTVAEQKDKKYPRNIFTACLFQETDESFGQDPVTWNIANNECLRPCRILERQSDGNGGHVYKAEVQEMPSKIKDPFCRLAKTHKIVEGIPGKAISLTDRAYTTDDHMADSFRDFISVPEGLYPKSWMREDTEDLGDFRHPKLSPGQIEPIRWESSGEPVTDNAYLIKMPKSVRKGLLDYCIDMDIASYFRQVTYRGNTLEPADQEEVLLGKIDWNVRRPPEYWKSNMHWMGPYDAEGHLDYLQELGMAGFDGVLKSIGEYFDMDGLAVFHVAFVGTGYSNGGYIHRDISGSGGKVFKIIIPLILADETGPELDISANGKAGQIGRLRYKNNVGIMLGDDVLHGASGTDYRAYREMRLLAVVYVGDINNENVDNILKHYRHHYPPAEKSLLLEIAGKHWKKGDPRVKLPEYNPSHDEL